MKICAHTFIRFCVIAAFIVTAQTAFSETRCELEAECLESKGCTPRQVTFTYYLSSCPIAVGPKMIFATTSFGELRGQEMVNFDCLGQNIEALGDHFQLRSDDTDYLFSVTDAAARLLVRKKREWTMIYRGKCMETG